MHVASPTLIRTFILHLYTAIVVFSTTQDMILGLRNPISFQTPFFHFGRLYLPCRLFHPR